MEKIKSSSEYTARELIRRSRSDIHMSWFDWNPAVNDLISIYEYTGGDSTELRQAREAAFKSVTHLKDVTKKVSREIENKMNSMDK